MDVKNNFRNSSSHQPAALSNRFQGFTVHFLPFHINTSVGSSNWDFVDSFKKVMDSIICSGNDMTTSVPCAISALDRHFSPSPGLYIFPQRPSVPPPYHRRTHVSLSLRPFAAVPSCSHATNSTPPKSRIYTVGDFMTRKDNLHVVKASTAVEDALESLVNKRVTGFPVVDDDWKLVGVVSDYDLLALDSISGGSQADTNLFPDVDSTWTTFSELQKLLDKTNGKVVGDLMTLSPLAVHESTNLEDAARMLLETKYRRLPVVDADGRLVGIITRGDIVKAALQIKRANEKM